MTHTLKTWPEYYKLIVQGDKNWELRKNDRDFQVGDTLILQEYNPITKTYSGSDTHKVITFILDGIFGLKKGHVIMSIKDNTDYE